MPGCFSGSPLWQSETDRLEGKSLKPRYHPVHVYRRAGKRLGHVRTSIAQAVGESGEHQPQGEAFLAAAWIRKFNASGSFKSISLVSYLLVISFARGVAMSGLS